MAEQTGSKDDDGMASQGKSLISDTISEMLQNPIQVDIAKTLGLLDDDPSTLAAAALDASDMQMDPILSLDPPSVLTGDQTVSLAGIQTDQSFPVPTTLEELTSNLLRGVGTPSTVAGEQTTTAVVTETDPAAGHGQKPPAVPTSLEALTSNLLLGGGISSASLQVAPSAEAKSLPQPVVTSSGEVPPSITPPTACEVDLNAINREQRPSVDTPPSAVTEHKSQAQLQPTSTSSSTLSPISIPSVTQIHPITTAASSSILTTASKTKKLRVDDLAEKLRATPTSLSAGVPGRSHVSAPSQLPAALLSAHLPVPVIPDQPKAVPTQLTPASATNTATTSLGVSLTTPATTVASQSPPVTSKTTNVAAMEVNVTTKPPMLNVPGKTVAGQPTAVGPEVANVAALQTATVTAGPAVSVGAHTTSVAAQGMSVPISCASPSPSVVSKQQSTTTSSAAAAVQTASQSSDSQMKKSSSPLEQKSVPSSTSHTQLQAVKTPLSFSGPPASSKTAESIVKMASIGTSTLSQLVQTQKLTKSPASAAASVKTPPKITPSNSNTNVVETPPTTTPTTTTSTATATPSTAPTAAAGASGSTQTDATGTAPKGLNLPILQFLQANFPALQLGDTSKSGVFQVHTLLAHVLQQQQQLQQLQQQAQQQVQKAVASGQPLPTATAGKSANLLSTATSGSTVSTPPPAIPSAVQLAKPVQPAKQVQPVAQAATSTTLPKTQAASSPSLSTSSTLSRTVKQRSPLPVFAQVLPQVSTGGATKVTISKGVVGRPSPVVVPKQPKNITGSFTSPLLLSRQKTKVSTTLASVPTPSSSLSRLPPTTTPTTTTQGTNTPLSTTKREGVGVRMSTRTAAKQQHLARTLIEPVDAEPMDVDVGEPFQILELPPHLRDHSYSRYNPEEGERILKHQMQNLRVFSGIPPARVSYAPPLPDSPNTLYKLLKILPKKTASRRSSTALSRTPSKKSSKRYVYPYL